MSVVSFTACHFDHVDKTTEIEAMCNSLFKFNITRAYISFSYDPEFKEHVDGVIMKLSYDNRICAVKNTVKLRQFEHYAILLNCLTRKDVYVVFIEDADLLIADVPRERAVMGCSIYDGKTVYEFSGCVAHFSVLSEYFTRRTYKIGFEFGRFMKFLEAKGAFVPSIPFVIRNKVSGSTWSSDVIAEIIDAYEKSEPGSNDRVIYGGALGILGYTL